jgi:hypothetical protein
MPLQKKKRPQMDVFFCLYICTFGFFFVPLQPNFVGSVVRKRMQHGVYLRWLRAAVPAFVRPSSLVLLLGGVPPVARAAAIFSLFLLRISFFCCTFAPEMGAYG